MIFLLILHLYRFNMLAKIVPFIFLIKKKDIRYNYNQICIFSFQKTPIFLPLISSKPSFFRAEQSRVKYAVIVLNRCIGVIDTV